MAGTNLALNEIIELRVWTADVEQAAVNVVHYKVLSLTLPITDLDVATAYDTTLAPLYKGIINNQAEYRGIQVQCIQRTPLTVAAFYNGSNGAGTAGATGMSRQTAGLVFTRTAFAGRKYRGRIYLPFPATADDAGIGLPSVGYQIRAVAIGAALFTPLVVTVGPGAVQLSPVIYHRAALTSDAITSSNCRSKWATQKRRGSYGRANSSPI